MDKRKVTRRAAIGLGIGGVAATPFILQALKGKYRGKLPPNTYDNAWSACLRMIDVAIREADGPAQFSLEPKPDLGARFRVLSLRASYETMSNGFPQPPAKCYFFAQATIEQVQPVVDRRPALRMHAMKYSSRGRFGMTELPGGDCVAVPMGASLDVQYFTPESREPIAPGKLSSASAELATRLIFDYPVGVRLKKNAKWMLPHTSRWCFELPCEVRGFADVGAYRTAEIVTAGDLSNEDCLHAASRWWEYEKKLAVATGARDGKEIEADLRADLKEIVAEKRTETWQIATYVDLKTGLVVREDARGTTHRQSHHDTRFVAITQVV